MDVTARSVASILFGALYSPKTAAILPMLIDRAAKNDFQGLLALAIAGDTSENMSVGMQLSVLCSEDATQITVADIARETAGSMFGPASGRRPDEGVRGVAQGLGGAGLFRPVVSDVPALVLSGDYRPGDAAVLGRGGGPASAARASLGGGGDRSRRGQHALRRAADRGLPRGRQRRRAGHQLPRGRQTSAVLPDAVGPRPGAGLAARVDDCRREPSEALRRRRGGERRRCSPPATAP